MERTTCGGRRMTDEEFYSLKIERKDICIDCCRKLNKVIEKALEEN